MANFDSPSAPRPSAGPAEAWAIALDGGTTNTRAHLLRGHRVIATSQRTVGARDTVLGDRGEPGTRHRARLVQAVREVVEEIGEILEGEAQGGRGAGDAPRPDLIVAAGMLSSEVGLVAVPHVEAPAGLDDLARAAAVVTLPEVDDRPILVVPGVRTPAAEGARRLVPCRRDARRGVRDVPVRARRGSRARGAHRTGSRPRSSSGPARIPSSSRSTPRGGSPGASPPSPARSSRRWRGTRSWPPACPRTGQMSSTRRPRPPAPAPSRTAGWAARAFLVRIAALSGALDEAGPRVVLDQRATVEADMISLLGHPILEPGRPVFVGGRDPLRGSLRGRSWPGAGHAGPVVPLESSLALSASAIGACAVAGRR